MNKRPRRPAQIDPEQVEYLTGEPDPAESSLISHAAAQALVPTDTRQNIDDDVRERIMALIDEEGIDLIAEAWVRAPADTLGGMLWRGYLLSEWIRREPDDVARRHAASEAVAESDDREGLSTPREIRERWEAVFAGDGAEGFAGLLRDSASFAFFLGNLDAIWISSDTHDLATLVTRRNDALIETAKELAAGAGLFDRGRLD
ncbi:hypothetical protein [Flaviflexus huanghaiensis]|uniref:hypothetical protein n=1 Tax=Flaviflexus huanghaiensis TaxID=1111473 RepID=UPI0015F9BBBA|nr:hypothetical protein [Flaviflexus huanghaiensis]